MKNAIISLLLSSMFFLPARGLAQQWSNDPVAGQAPVQQWSMGELAREQKVLKAVRSSLKELCSGEMKENAKCKLVASNQEYREELVKKTVAENPDIQTYIKTGVLPDKPIKTGGLLAPDKPDSDTLALDKSWMSTGLSYQQTETSGGHVQQAPTSIIQVPIMSLSCENLAKAALQNVDPKLDVEFPGRGDWERDYCRDRELWYRQYLRWEGHKGTSTERQEYDLAAQAWSLLQGVMLEGPALARQYLERIK
jgi:hypothetical protein